MGNEEASGVCFTNPKARDLLIEAVRDKDGLVIKTKSLDGLSVGTNGKQFVEKGNPRSEAEGEAAVDELCEMGYLKSEGYKGVLFKVTHEGYRVADSFSSDV